MLWYVALTVNSSPVRLNPVDVNYEKKDIE